nr:hypothetical protein [Tanacetum cinerariifolium]
MIELEKIKKEKEGLDSKLTGFESASKDLDTLLGSQRSDKNKEGLRYSVVPSSCSRAAPPKPKASVQRTRSSSDTSITPPTAAASPRLTASTKGKQTAKSSKAKNEGTSSIPRVPDAPTDEFEEELFWNSTDDECADDEGKDGDDNEEDEGDDGEEGDDDDYDKDDDGDEGDDNDAN